MEVKIGYVLAKPVETQAQCDAYTAMVEAVNAHNAACAVGDTLWVIEDGTDSYTVAADVVVREPTAEELAEIKESLRTEKLKEVSADCEKAIYAGVDVIFADESQKHFSLQPNDQTNIDGVFNAIVLGATEYPYHADGEPCKMYSAADIVSLYVASKGYITKQTTYNNALRQ